MNMITQERKKKVQEYKELKKVCRERQEELNGFYAEMRHNWIIRCAEVMLSNDLLEEESILLLECPTSRSLDSAKDAGQVLSICMIESLKYLRMHSLPEEWESIKEKTGVTDDFLEIRPM